MSLSSLHDDYDVKFSNYTVCGWRLWKARFPYIPKTFGNFHEKVDRMNNVFHLTQVRFVYAFVTAPKFKMVAQISPWIAYNWWLFVNEHALPPEISDGKRGPPFQNCTYSQELSGGTPPKRVFNFHIPTGISGISWQMESAQDNDFLFLFLNFDPVLWKNLSNWTRWNRRD